MLGNGHSQLREELDMAIMHDAVLNTAIVWKHVWNKLGGD